MSILEIKSPGILERAIRIFLVVCFLKPLIAIAFLLALVAIALGFVFIAFLIYVSISSYFADRKFKEEYEAFLSRVSGTHFFFYNSRRSSVSFAREAVVPLLGPTIKVVFVDGEDIDVGNDSRFISHMLYGVKHKKGFPYLIKIDKGRPLDYSVNNLFYNTMNGKKPIQPLLKRIDAFYNSPAVLE